MIRRPPRSTRTDTLVPYTTLFRSPDGFDCSGLVQYVYRLAGVQLPRTTREQHAYGRKVDIDDAEPGDLLFYSFTGHGIDHVAIYLGDDEAVHAPASGRSVIVAGVHLKYWQRHFVDARRVLRFRAAHRSEARRVGKACVVTGRSRWAPYH